MRLTFGVKPGKAPDSATYAASSENVTAVGKSKPVTNASRKYPGGTDTFSSFGAIRCPCSALVSDRAVAPLSKHVHIRTLRVFICFPSALSFASLIPPEMPAVSPRATCPAG